MSDAINPSHYKHLPVEAIDIIEAAIAKAPSNKAAYLQGQVLKYLLRCWEKKGIEDLRKAKWYLDRLIKSFDDLLAEINALILEGQGEDQLPEGWRKMSIGEDIDQDDKFWGFGRWVSYEKDKPPIPRGKLTDCHVTHIRKIEESPKRYREPTPADLANGPIECEYRDFDGDDWVAGYLTEVIELPGFGFSFRCHSLGAENDWNQCRIEVQE